MCGNGAKIGTDFSPPENLSIREGLKKVMTASFAAAVGSLPLNSVVLSSKAIPGRKAGPSIPASALCFRILQFRMIR